MKRKINWTENAAPWITRELVKAARALLNWTQADLARAAGIGQSTLADFERGTRKTDLVVRMQLVAALAREHVRFCRSRPGSHRMMFGVQRLGGSN